MNIEEQRKAFDRWVLTHHDNLDLTAYEENIMFDAWLASANREGYKLVPVQPSNDTIVAIERKVEEQLEASAIDADPFRLDGENIYKAMIGACDE